MKPLRIQIQNTSLQEGITSDPVICWQYGKGDAGTSQAACRIELRKNGWEVVADTGRMETGRQNNHQLKAFLESHCWYDVKVTVWDEMENVACGISKPYLSGIDERRPWPGKWIGTGEKTPFLCFRCFQADQSLTAAYLSVAAAGQYECRINGMLPDGSVLNGSWTDFHKRIHYRTFDITELLRKGENCVSIEVGNGWYLGYAKHGRYFYTLDKGYEPYGDCLGAAAVITLVHEDGSRKTVVTDKTWQITESPVTYTNIYGSEDYDARREKWPWKDTESTAENIGRSEEEKKADKGLSIGEGWRSEPCSAVELTKRGTEGSLVPALYPPVTILRTYEGKAVFVCPDGSLVYDLGQNMAGFVEVGVQGKSGEQIRVSCAETWESGMAFQPSTNSWCTYTLKAQSGVQTFQPKFTYQAGRYVCISFPGAESPVVEEKERQDGDVSEILFSKKEMSYDRPKIVYVRGHFMGSSARETGHFFCSDNRYMQVYDLVERAVESNLNHVHTDCPTYERLGWQEPNHLMGPSIMYMKDVNTLWDKIEQDQCDSQYGPEEFDTDKGVFPHQYGPGLLPSVAPRYARFLNDYGSGSFWDIIPWGSSLLMGSRERERFYGDASGCIRYYDAMKRYVEYQYQKYLHYDKIYGRDQNFTQEKKKTKTPIHFLRQGLGDWGVVQGNGDGRENIETAYLYQDLVLVSETAGILGRYEEQKDYAVRAEKLCEEYNRVLLRQDPNNGFWYYHTYDSTDRDFTQANQAIPLQFHMVPREKRASVEAAFVHSVRTSGILAGEVGMPYIFRTLGELGEMELVEQMIFRDAHPSYYRFLTTGETTLPEFWRDDARSRNHDMMGSVIEWFYRYLAGLSSEDGFRTIKIQPRLPESLSFVECSYEAITGDIFIKAERIKDSKLSISCEIPVNTLGVIVYKDNEYSIQGGIRYQLVFPETC